MLVDVIKKFVPPWLKQALRTTRSKQIVDAYSRRTVSHNYVGFDLLVDLADPLGEAWYDRDWPEEASMSLLKKHGLKPGAIVFDMGAHQGVMAMILAKLASPGGRVIALEATKHNVEVGLSNLRLNQVDNVELLFAAAAEESGWINFDQNFNGQVASGISKGLSTKVQAWSVDDLARKYQFPEVLFVDVEGFEVHVLRGAKETLARKPDCDIEVHCGCGLENFGFTAKDVIAFFPESDYDCYVYSHIKTELQPATANFPFPDHNFHLIAIAK